MKDINPELAGGAVAEKSRFSSELSENALAVIRGRYLKKDEGGVVTETLDELFRRVAAAVAEAEKQLGVSAKDTVEIGNEFYRLMATGHFLPNSPTLMNAGRANGVLSACFVIPVDDSIDSIFTAVKNAASVQKAGGGTGFSFSRLRPRGDRVASSGGITSGPLSFVKVFSEATNAIQQGAFRRGANMGVMHVDHPDIIEFINTKSNLDQLPNFNLSVAVTDKFMMLVRDAPETEHITYNPRNHHPSKLLRNNGGSWTVGEVFDLIVLRAWEAGEPGILFIDRVNQTNPTPRLGLIEATNPCGEQPLLPYECCTLGSINLARFVTSRDGQGTFDFEGFKGVIRLAVRFLDDVIDANSYPIPETAEITKGNRKIGLGVMGFADTLFALKIPYNSETALQFGQRLMEFLQIESHRASQELAEQRGVFPNWEKSVWRDRGIRIRNACTSCVAPTGTISIIANCSSGIEPLFSVAFFRNVLDGQRLSEVNRAFEAVAKKQGFYSKEMIAEIAERGSIQSVKHIPEDVRRVFVTAHDIAPDWHVRMQAAFQKHCDAAISKTINLPPAANIQDVRKAHLLAFELGCKGVTVYRDGCRTKQPMTLSKTGLEQSAVPVAKPMDLPAIMPAVRIRQMTPFGNMHVKIVIDPTSGREREIFAQLGKGGDLANSDLEAICRLSSLYLRVGGALEDVTAQLEGIGSSLSIPTKDGRISSLADGLAKAIAKYKNAKDSLVFPRESERTSLAGQNQHHSQSNQHSHPELGGFTIKCPQPECKSALVFQEGCVKCLSCGYSAC